MESAVAATDVSRLIVRLVGAYETLSDANLGQDLFATIDRCTPIDGSWQETLATKEKPISRSYPAVVEKTEIDFGGLINPRAALVVNLAGADDQKWPTDERKAELRRLSLHVGPPECPDLCTLPAREIGATQQGCFQLFLLSPGKRLVVAPATEGLSVPVRVVVFPGNKGLINA